MQKTNWHEIYTAFSPKLLGICRRYIKDIATAEDIVQDSFIVAIQKESDLKNKKALKGWLCRIVINRAISYLKNEKLTSYADTTNLEYIDETTEMNTVVLDKRLAILASDFSHEDLLEAIDSLSENHKTVFNLYIIDEFSHIEISKLLQISVGTSKSSLSRARKNVQQFLVDKLKNKTDEKKKRRIAFLLFFGFGNQLFANYYKKSFNEFEIKPKKAFDSSKKIENIAMSFVIKSNAFSNYMKTGVVLFGVVLLILFLYKEKNVPITTVKTPIVNKNQVKVITEDSIHETHFVKKDSLIKNEIKPKVKAKKITPKITLQKDSLSVEEPKKIVVVKRQIIKKDTVYVEKK